MLSFCSSFSPVSLDQPADVVLSNNLVTAKVEAVTLSHPRVTSIAAPGALSADDTLVAFADSSLLVLHHNPMSIDVYVNGALDTTINQR